MAFPKKFKDLLETKPGQVEEPKYAWLTYAVCGAEQDSCGWGGWILESVEGSAGQLPSDTRQVCPVCGKDTFRTEVTIKYEQSKNQTKNRVAGRDYEVVPMEYE